MTPGDLLVIVGMALAVYVPKALPLVVVSEGLTARLRPWLQRVAPAVLGALVAPSILTPAGHLAAPAWNQTGYLVAFVVARLTRRMVTSWPPGW
jgi:branched-subunit amino acid transport protein